MSESRYVYNSSTLRYERARRSVLSVIAFAVGVMFVGALFFIGLIYLQNYFIETPLEQSLRAENKALRHYKMELAAQVELASTQMNSLETKDKTLYEKIFETQKAGHQVEEQRSDKEILLADVTGFHDLAGTILSKFSEVSEAARVRNTYFGKKASVAREDIAFLSAVPSYAPVAEFDATKLVSGFGIRINPFHKGNYHHDGIDIASPRGTEVLAAGPGIVTMVSHSELQAGFGNYMEIDHGNGYVTRYANLGEIKVYHGQKVTRGFTIGVIGISGGSVAPHVHYEVLKYGRNMDPVKFLLHGLDARQFELVFAAGAKQNQSLD